jgi:site-specific recombinase XerD
LNDVALGIIKAQKGKNSEFVFTSKEGHQIHPDKIYHALKNALEQIGLEGDVHKLRHTFASSLAMKGVDLGSIRDLLGHTDIATTQRYAHLAPDHLRKAVRALTSGQKEAA